MPQQRRAAVCMVSGMKAQMAGASAPSGLPFPHGSTCLHLDCPTQRSGASAEALADMVTALAVLADPPLHQRAFLGLAVQLQALTTWLLGSVIRPQGLATRPLRHHTLPPARSIHPVYQQSPRPARPIHPEHQHTHLPAQSIHLGRQHAPHPTSNMNPGK